MIEKFKINLTEDHLQCTFRGIQFPVNLCEDLCLNLVNFITIQTFAIDYFLNIISLLFVSCSVAVKFSD